MKTLLVLFCFISFQISLMAQIETKEHPIDVQLKACLDKDENQTTLGMINCEAEAQVAWDKALNDNYKELRGMLKGEDRERLKLSQRQWIKYRDLELEFSSYMHYNMEGTLYRVIGAGRQTEFVKARALELRDYIETLSMQ